MRGFDVDEVDKFLEKIAEEFLILTLENKQIMEKVESLEKEISNFRNKEQTFQNAILSAQRISDEMQEKSRLEADNTLTLAKQESEELLERIGQEAEAIQEKAVREANELKQNAEAEAARIESEAKTQIHDLTNEVNNLIEMRDRVTDDMKQLLGNYLQKISEGIPEDLGSLEKLPEPEVPQPAAVSEDSESINPAPDDDFGDLYEKIDLPDEAFSLQGDATPVKTTEPEELGLEDIEPLGLDEDEDHSARVAIQVEEDDDFDQDPDISIPDLEGDMLFSLDDPLDELEPSVTISPDENK